MTYTAPLVCLNNTFGKSHVVGTGQVDIEQAGKPIPPAQKVHALFIISNFLVNFITKSGSLTLKMCLNLQVISSSENIFIK